ncbi:Atlastin-1 [Folsomia candida]|uniref:Atlastin-1 n=1 Tax=Folsomia candida TaxID=158441 RepID=A0A226D3G6_FOLCA|nr:Atlastin-1 [Folsomia candida]
MEQKYAVVVFKECKDNQDIETVEAIPVSWISNGSILWPNNYGHKVLKKAIKRCESPKEDWTQYQGRVLGQYGTLQEARQESKVAEGTSDLSSAKRRVVKKNVGPVTQLPNPPRHQIEEMASTSQTIYTIQELLAAGVDTGRNQEGDHFAGNEGDDFGGMERGEIILNNAMSQAPPQRVEEMNRTVGDQGLLPEILKKIERITIVLDRQQDQLDEIVQILKNNQYNQPLASSQQTFSFPFGLFPLRDSAALSSLDEQLKNDEAAKNALIRKLKDCGGATLLEAVKGMMSFLMTDELCSLYSHKGKRGKLSLADHALLVNSIFDALMRNPRTSGEATLIKYYEVLPTVLKQAHDRVRQRREFLCLCPLGYIRFGEPVQIVTFKRLPIAGAPHQGKSFLLTVVLNVLERLSRGQMDYWEDLEQLDSLTGFHGTKIAVMLTDTQGVFDPYTTERDWAMIVGLSLLTSSCLIYNLFTNMQEDTLKIFHNFVEFGVLSLEEDSTATSAFQKLIFLIRDWNFPSTHGYGQLGGSIFLEKKLSVTPGMPPEVIKVRQTLATCFEEISCFLMPNPGEAAKENNFSGALSTLSEAFRENLRIFVDNLISIDDLKPIKIGNNIIDGTSLLSYFEKYVEVFNGKTMPPQKSLYQAMEEARLGACITKFCNQAREKFERIQKSCEYIPRLEFKLRQGFHLGFAGSRSCPGFENLKTPTKFVAEGNKTRNHEFVKQYRAKLLSDLKTLFGEIFARNESSKNFILNQILDLALARYKSILAEKTRQTLPEQDIKDILESEVKNALLKIRQDCGGREAEFQREAETNLKGLMDTENATIIDQNSTRFKEIERICQKSLQTCTLEYSARMDLALGEELKSVTQERLNQSHNMCESMILPIFRGPLDNESESIQAHFRHQFNTALNQVRSEYAEKCSTARNEASSAARNLYTDSYNSYAAALTALAESGTASESDLKTEHRFKVLEACQKLNQIHILCSPEEAREFENNMRKKTTQFYDELIARIHKSKRY